MRKSILISEECYETLLRWGLCSWREISAICLGSRGKIQKVVRLRNIEKFPRFANSHSSAQYKSIKTKYSNKYSVLAEAHSHPGGPARPSRGDIEAIPFGKIELIICTKSKKVTAWKIQTTWKQTIKCGKLDLIIVSRNARNRKIISCPL